jgi:HEAT repeat protein
MPLVRKPPATAPVGPDNRSSQPDNVAKALLEGSDEERWNAARSAATSPDGLAALSAALSRETHPRVREAIFTSLARIRTPASAEAVAACLRSDDSSLRTGALDALRAMPDAAASCIPGLLADDDADVRLLACELVRNRPSAEAGRMLGPLLAAEHEPNVCAAAIEVLAETGAPELLPHLARCAARFPNDPFLAFAVKVASDRIRSQALPRV